MVVISPNPLPWKALYEQLVHYGRTNSCVPPSPPRPLILAGWVYSNDLEKNVGGKRQPSGQAKMDVAS